jgi:uncharacterized protein (DUF1697 family)
MSVSFVALLRGINVGTAKRVAMADLRRVVEELGFHDVKTLLNSGNVVFSGEEARTADVAASIEQAVQEATGVSARTIALTSAEFQQVVAENPITEPPNPSRLLVVFLFDPVDRRELAAMAKDDWTPETVAVGSRAGYFWCPDGVLESRALKAAGKVLTADVTTRNWATVLKIQALLAKSDA